MFVPPPAPPPPTLIIPSEGVGVAERSVERVEMDGEGELQGDKVLLRVKGGEREGEDETEGVLERPGEEEPEILPEKESPQAPIEGEGRGLRDPPLPITPPPPPPPLPPLEIEEVLDSKGEGDAVSLPPQELLL